MTLLHDQLSALADSVPIPPAPTVLDLERAATASRRPQTWIYAVAAAAVLTVIAGVAAWWLRPDRAIEPAPAPAWSDLDVPYTADGHLHWRAASVPVTEHVAVASGKDVVFLWNDNTVTEVRPDGSTRRIATDTQGPVIADPDGTVATWRTRDGIEAYDAATGSLLGSFDDPASQNKVIPWAVSEGVIYATAGGDAIAWEPSPATGRDSGSGSGGPGASAVVEARSGWRITTSSDGGPRAVGPDGQQVHIRTGESMLLSPEAAHVVVRRAARVTVTDLPDGTTTRVQLPGGYRLFGERWVGRDQLVETVTKQPDTDAADDPLLEWFLCSAPDWACDPLAVPAQPLSQAALPSTSWMWMIVADSVTVTSESEPATVTASGS